MAEYITLHRFHAASKHFHIYRIQKTKVAHMEHYHNYYQVCYVVSGEIIHRQTHDTVTLTAGDAFIVPPGLTHSLHFQNSHAEIYSLAFEESLFSPGFSQSNAYQFLAGLQAKVSIPKENSIRLRVTLNRNQRKLMEGLLEMLVWHQDTECPPGLSTIPSMVSSIVYLLAQSYYRQPENTSELHDLASYSGTMLKCIDYIDRHFRDPLSLKDLAKMFGLSQSAFCSVFPQFAGTSLRRYIANKRIKEAQVLIRSHPNRPISQVAAEVGYQDDSTFYRNFLRITGLSPSRYKDAIR